MLPLVVGVGLLLLMRARPPASLPARADTGAAAPSPPSAPVNGGLVFVPVDLVPVAPIGPADPVASFGSLVGTVSPTLQAELAAASERISGSEGNPIVAPVEGLPSGGFAGFPVVRV